MASLMKYLVAALAATTAAGLAGAFDSQKSGDGYVYAPTTLGSRHPLAYVDEPVASVASGTPADAPEHARMTAVTQALNAEPSLKGSKMTVVSDGEVIVLMGVTVTREQMAKAMQIAESHAGQAKIGNAITTEELKIVQNPPVTAATLEVSSPDPQSASSAEAGETILPATPDGEKILPATPQA